MFTHLSQGRRGSRGLAWLSVLGLILAMIAASIEPAEASAAPDGDVSVVVREVTSETETAEDLVESLDGVVGHQLAIIGGFAATVSSAALGVLAAHVSALPVTTDTTPAPM